MQEFFLTIQPDAEEPEAGEILVDGAVGGRPYRFLLDTGAARSCLAWDSYSAAFEEVGQHRSSGVFAAHSSDVIRVPSIQLGPILRRDFSLTRLGEHNTGMHSLIGMDLLKDYRLHFLFDENRVLVDGMEPEVPLHDLFVDSKSHPYVDAAFGDQTAAAVWDTGASITVVDLGLIARCPACFREVSRASGSDATGASMEAATYLMRSAVMGGHVFPPHRVAGVDLSHVNASTERRMDMILGYSTMRKANWWFDFPGRRWAITRMLG